MKRILTTITIVTLLALLVFAAAPPIGSYIVPSFFTTNAAKIYGTNGLTVSSNPVTGIYLMDGRDLTNGFSSTIPFNTNQFSGGGTTNIKDGVLLTNANITWNAGGGIPGTILSNDNNGGIRFYSVDAGNVFHIDNNGNTTFEQASVTYAQATASTIAFFNSLKELKSVANALGALTNNGSGTFGWFNSFLTDASLTHGISVQSNAFGGTVGSGTNLLFLVTSNLTLTATNTATGGKTNSVSHDTAQPITTFASPTFANIGITTDGIISNHLAIGSINTATNRLSAFKTRFFALTNATVGYGDWMAGTPSAARRNWFLIQGNGAGVSSLGCQSVQSIGSLVNAEATTNEWPAFTYTTGATTLSSNGLASQTAATTLSMFPGKNLYFAFVGRITSIVTNRTWIGYTSATTATMGANSDTPTTSHVAAFRFSTAASGALTNWSLVTCDGSACTVQSGPISLSNTNIHIFEILEDRPNTRWLGYIDGICIATNTANLPINGMKYVAMVSTLEGVAKGIRGSVIYGEMDNRVDGTIVYNP